MKRYQYVILGGGLAAGYAAQTFVEEGGVAGELAIVSAESRLPYERPPLSKAFLAGEKSKEDVLINEEQYYDENGIDVHLSTRVSKVDINGRQLHTEDGQTIGFEKLLIATGARVRPFEVEGAELDNIFYLRQVNDSVAIREAAKDVARAVVIGGSFIGMEVASVLQSEGVDVTMVFPEERVWASFFTPEMSDYFENYYKEKGVTLMPGEKVTRFEGKNGRLTHIILGSGQKLEAPMAVAGIGVIPNSELFEETAVELKNGGIVVNKFLETSVEGIYAAGDVARYPDQIFDKPKRVEHWDNAVTQGQHAMRGMMGQREVFDHLPYFFSDVFDLSYEYWGDSEGAEQIIHRGDVESGSFSVWWLDGAGSVLAAFVMDRPEEERELAQRWIRSGVDVTQFDLENDTRTLKPLIDENSPPG